MLKRWDGQNLFVPWESSANHDPHWAITLYNFLKHVASAVKGNGTQKSQREYVKESPVVPKILSAAPKSLFKRRALAPYFHELRRRKRNSHCYCALATLKQASGSGKLTSKSLDIC